MFAFWKIVANKNEKIKLDVNLDMINTKVVFDRKEFVLDSKDKSKTVEPVSVESNDYAERIRKAMMEKGEKVDDYYVVSIEDDVEISYDVKGDFINLNFYNGELVEEKMVKDVNICDTAENKMHVELKKYINKYILEGSN